MIVCILAMAVAAGQFAVGSADSMIEQIRPGSFTGKRPSEAARAEGRMISADFQAAWSLYERRRPYDALKILLPWRARVVTEETEPGSPVENSKQGVRRLIYISLIAIEDYHGAVSMAQDWYSYLDDRGSSEPGQRDALRLITAYHLSGQEQQAWDFFNLYGESKLPSRPLDYYFSAMKDEPIDRDNFGYALMMAAAKETLANSMTQQVFYQKAIEQRPDDAVANMAMGRLVSGYDLKMSLPYFDVVRNSDDEELAKRADREYKTNEWRIAFRKRAAGGM